MEKKAASGMDINLGNSCSQDAYAWAKKTFVQRAGKAGALAPNLEGGFSNLLLFGQERIGIASDGIGTKIELAERSKKYDTLGFDLLAMVADDLATAGFEPTNLSNIIDVDHLDQAVINELMKGLSEACAFTGVSITGGEIAELGNRISGYGEGMHFNWCSTAIGHLPSQLAQPIDGNQIEEGQVIVAVKSQGFRSNGFSLIRRIMEKNFGPDWQHAPYDETCSWGEKLLTPSLICAPLINKWLNHDILPTGLVHITGGGIADNFRRLLKRKNKGARLENLFAPLPMMKKVMSLGEITLEDAYLYWNMGNAFLAVLPAEQLDAALALAQDTPYQLVRAGEITATSHIQIVLEEKTLNYNF